MQPMINRPIVDGQIRAEVINQLQQFYACWYKAYLSVTGGDTIRLRRVYENVETAGLCTLLREYAFEKQLDDKALKDAQRLLFRAAYLHPIYPFDDSIPHYRYDFENQLLHLNQNRIDFVYYWMKTLPHITPRSVS